MSGEVLRLAHFSCKVGQTRFFSDLSFSLREGEIHGLAGLSPEQRDVLIRYFSGALPGADGQLFAFGELCAPADAKERIFCIRRQSSLIERMTVTENLFVLPAGERSKPLVVNRRELGAACQQLIDQYGLPLDASSRVGDLTRFGRIAVELLGAAAAGARVIFYNRGLDELPDHEFSRLHTLLLSLAMRGTVIVPLCGQPARMLQVCSRVTSVKQGVTIQMRPSEQTSVLDIRRAILGAYEPPQFHAAAAAKWDDRPLLSMRGLRLCPSDRPFDLEVSRGEIVGLVDYGSAGADRILQAIYGLTPCSCYHFAASGVPIPTERPDRAFAAGILLVRHIENGQELLWGAPVRESIAMPLLSRSAAPGGVIRKQFLDLEIMQAAKTAGLTAAQLARPLTPDLVLRAQLARILLSHRPVLLLENPFVGLAPEDDYLLKRFVVKFAEAGNCVLFSSTHFSEIAAICSRCYQLSGNGLIEQAAYQEGGSTGAQP